MVSRFTVFGVSDLFFEGVWASWVWGFEGSGI